MATSRELEGGSPREPTTTTNFSAVLPPHWKREVEGWIRDDVPSIDIGGLVVGDKPETAHLYGKSRGILAGVPFFDAVFEFDPRRRRDVQAWEAPLYWMSNICGFETSDVSEGDCMPLIPHARGILLTL